MNDTKNPTQWLTELLAEVDLFDAAAFPPRDERRKDETVVGECPDGLRKFYAFSQYCEREIAQAKLDSKFASKEEHDEIGSRIGLLDMKQELVQDIFQGCLTDYFNDWQNDGHLHIRENWEVVRCKRCGRDQPGLPDLLRGFGFQIGPQE
jgi:hypothetical protein